MTQKPWFKGDLGKNFNRRQQAENILPRIALTAVDPTHPEAFSGSCHSYIARKIRENLTGEAAENPIQDTDEIVLIGSNVSNTVFHTIITRGNNTILHDRTMEHKGVRSVDLEAGHYYSELYEHTNRQLIQGVEIMNRISYGDFKTRYLENIVVGTSPGSDPTP